MSNRKNSLIPADASNRDAIKTINDGGYEIALVADDDIRRGLLDGLNMSIPRPMKSKTADKFEPDCVPLEVLPAHIKQSYRRLALVTDSNQLDQLDAGDEDTLIVSCDWLSWQQALAEKRHAVHYELGLVQWDPPDSLDRDLFIRANDWLYGDEGLDLTVFHGVSLGKLSGTQVALALSNYHRIRASLLTLISRFTPKDILLYDFANDISFLDRPFRKEIIKNVVESRGLGFLDCSDGIHDNGQQMSEKTFASRGHGPVAQAILFLYTRALEILTNIRSFATPRRRRVLIIANNNLSEPLVKAYQGGDLTPIFMSRTIPKRPGVLWHCLKNGILLIEPKAVSLTGADNSRLTEISSNLNQAFSKPSDGALAFMRSFVRRQVLETGRMDKMARDVLAAERVMDRYRPHRVVVDGKRNHPVRTYLELARARAIETDHMWHAPLVPQYLQYDAFGCDLREKSIVTRCLSWGRINEAWLDAIEARPPRVRIGCPLSDRYIDSKPMTTGKGGNALVLQYAPIISDLRSLNSTLYSLFVDVIRLLNDKGYENIRFKLHPGAERFKKSYFEKIARAFGIGCDILKTEPFEECVAWADIVIGPAASGAMFETLAAGKPYYAMLLPPHSMNPGFFGDYPVHASVEELDRALDRPISPEAARNLLDGLYSIEKYPSGSKRFWQVMNEGA